MRRSWLVPALIIFAACGSFARAQMYPHATPAPRTTSVPELRALATGREVVERFHLGLAAEQRADWASAAAEFERIVALNPGEPQNSTARYDLAIAYANMRRFDDAARQLQSAIARDPGFLAAMANLIAVDLSRGDLRDARAVADRFVAAAPDSARALYERGLVALRSGDMVTARNDFGQFLQANPKYAYAHYNLGLAQTKTNDYASAEREFQLAVDLAPQYSRARFALGTVLLHEGKRAQARAAFATVAGDAATDPALRNLAVAMRDAIKSR